MIYFGVERYEARLKDRKLKGFGQAEEEVRAMFASRYPRAVVGAYTKFGTLPAPWALAAFLTGMPSWIIRCTRMRLAW